MERQIRDYEQRSAEMDSRINKLRSDRDSLEKFAREKFYFSAPGEDIYIVNDKWEFAFIWHWLRQRRREREV